jgi:amino acid permease
LDFLGDWAGLVILGLLGILAMIVWFSKSFFNPKFIAMAATMVFAFLTVAYFPEWYPYKKTEIITSPSVRASTPSAPIIPPTPAQVAAFDAKWKEENSDRTHNKNMFYAFALLTAFSLILTIGFFIWGGKGKKGVAKELKDDASSVKSDIESDASSVKSEVSSVF